MPDSSPADLAERILRALAAGSPPAVLLIGDDDGQVARFAALPDGERPAIVRVEPDALRRVRRELGMVGDPHPVLVVMRP